MAPLTSTPVSLLPFQNPFLPLLSLSPILSQIHRKPATFLAGIHGITHRKTRRKPPEKSMSVSVQMPTPSHRRDRDDDTDVDSRNCKFSLCSVWLSRKRGKRNKLEILNLGLACFLFKLLMNGRLKSNFVFFSLVFSATKRRIISYYRSCLL